MTTISIKLSGHQWRKLAYYPDERIRTTREMKQYIKDTYHGTLVQGVGIGSITFEHEYHLTWFLLNV